MDVVGVAQGTKAPEWAQPSCILYLLFEIQCACLRGKARSFLFQFGGTSH